MLIVTTLVFSCDSATNPDDGDSTLTLSAPAVIDAGTAFDLTVTAAGNQSGSVELDASSGSISPSSLSLMNGTGTATVQLSAGSGEVEITASLDGSSAAATVSVAPRSSLPGDPGDSAAEAIPSLDLIPTAENYSTGNPLQPWAQFSHNTLIVQLDPVATVGAVNAMLAAAGAGIVGGVSGTAGAFGGILMLQLATSNHEELAAAEIDILADPSVLRTTTDQVLVQAATSKVDGPLVESNWDWDLPPAGGNWGLEQIRVPAMWNLNGQIDKANLPSVQIAVIDYGFKQVPHPDLDIDLSVSSSAEDFHGMHVAGIIGATINNNEGVDGVTPYVNVIGFAPPFGLLTSGFILTGYRTLLNAYPDIRVINTSFSYDFEGPVDTWTNPAGNAGWEDFAYREGEIFADLITDQRSSQGRAPIMTVAAGNDSNHGVGLVPANLASSFGSAGLNFDIDEVLVVEATDDQDVRAAFSNILGTLSAPGVCIHSTSDGSTRKDCNGTMIDASDYISLNGTSMAAPHVAGVIGFMLAIDPSLSTADIREILLANLVPAGSGAAGRVDAYACVIDIDRVKMNDAVLRMLLDIDDGTADGNRRVLADGSIDNDVDSDNDGGIGDGAIDMSDFRRWRDWYLFLEDRDDLQLDGDPYHIKMDLNDDGITDDPFIEMDYPRGDFNGDGKIETGNSSKAKMPGALGGAELTDLEVLKHLFDDPYYEASDLNGLINSGDLHLDFSECFTDPDVTSVEVVVYDSYDDEIESREHTSGSQPAVYTVPISDEEYRVVATTKDGEDVVGSSELELAVVLGSDTHWRPTCEVQEFDFAYVTTQAEVDELAGVTRIGGRMIIGPSTDIVDLSPLSSLTELGEELMILENALLVSLSGLENLTEAAALSIRDNPLLANLNGLGVQGMVTYVFIYQNEALTSVAGLSGITLVIDAITVRGNPVLPSLGGLQNVTGHVPTIRIDDNPAMQSISGLSAVSSCAGLWVVGTAIGSLSGLGGITSAEQITIQSNPELSSANLGGLSGEVESISIGSNPALTSVTLGSSITVGSLGISRNNISSFTSLEGTDVVGSLALVEEPVVNLDGLSAISHLSVLRIKDNTQLVDIDGLSGLEAIAPDATYPTCGIEITGNSALCDTLIASFLDGVEYYGCGGWIGGNMDCD